MLKGFIKYKDEDFGEVIFNVLAKHSVNIINFHISLAEDENTKLIIGDNNVRTKYMNVIDKGRDSEGKIVKLFKEGIEWEVKGEKVTKIPSYERNIVVNTESNKVTTNVGNLELASRLGAIVSYCKQNAVLNTSTKYFSIILTGHLDNKTSEKYKNIEATCDIVYKLSEIVKLDISSPYFEIHLDYADENELSDACFKPLKQKDKWGNILSNTPVKIITVKMIESNLGWKIQQTIKKTVSVMGMYQTIDEVIAAHPEKDTSWILDRKYEIVTDEMLESLVKEFMEYDGYIAFDTETTGLKINFLSREGRGDQLVGVILSKEIGTGYYFPLQNKYIKNLCNGDHYYVMEHYLKPILEQKKIVAHNGTYDWKVAYIYGIFVNIVYDTMIALGVTKRYEILNFELGLKALAKSLLGLDMFDLDDFIVGDNEWGDDGEITFADLPYELVRRYGPADGDMTLSLKKYIDDNHIIEDFDAQKVFDLEIQFSKVVAYSEFWGYHIDVERIPELQKKIVEEMEYHKNAAYKIAGHEFNMNSPVQLNQVMYDELKIEPIEGKRGTDKNILKTLSEKEKEDGTPMYPFVKHLKAYRDVESIYKNFLKRLKEFATDDGFIFPDVLFLGTETGRCSVHNPNYQSYNDTVKHYVVPRKDFIMGDSDFGQIEYRTLASMAPEPALIEAFDDPDLDYHQYQASRMFNVPYAAVTKKLRQQSKGINFGLPYGMGDASLGARIFGQRTPENTTKAAALREKFFEGQDNIRAFFDKVRDNGVKNGYTSTLEGRRRYYHKGKFTEAEIRRQAGNHVIQGCLSGDVYIQTQEFGIVPIKSVVDNALHVWDGKAWTKGIITYSGKKLKCIIHFDSGKDFICSPDHKFAVGDDTFVRCADLKANEHKILTCQHSPFYGRDNCCYIEQNLSISSIEFTDEYIDMYDVCNTERGYFVADGIITHNSAADIYKMAVVRFFNFIVKEGLLDKILINAFIHDEILFEVHKSVDMLWFTTKWREAFEVPLKGFCKLYAGLGYGKCWYDAKKQDLPTGFITALCELANDSTRASKDFIFDNVNAETGYVWDDDIEKFIANVKYWFKNYKFQRVFDYIQDEKEQGKMIKPAVWSLLTECVSDLIPAKVIEKFENNEEGFCNNFVSRVKQEVGEQIIIYDETNGECKIKCKELDQYIKVYSIFMGIDYTKINILSPDAADKVQKNEKVELEVKSEEDSFSSCIKSAMLHIQIMPFVANEGYNLLFVNAEDNIAINLLKDKTIRDDAGMHTEETESCLRVCLLVPSQNKHILTTSYIKPKEVTDITCNYLMLKKGGVFF